MPEVKKPQSAVSRNSIDKNTTHKPLKPQNTFKKPQLCGTEPLPSIPIKEERYRELKGATGKQKPFHGCKAKDHRRIWFDRGTEEWEAYSKDYQAAHSGILPPTNWDGAGSWFNLVGEI